MSVCVTEQRNDLNAPTMFYTPAREGFMHNVNLLEGMKQEIMFGEIDFDLGLVSKYELTKNTNDYYPMVISINYSLNNQNYAYISYCNFVKDSQGNITGAKTVK